MDLLEIRVSLSINTSLCWLSEKKSPEGQESKYEYLTVLRALTKS